MKARCAVVLPARAFGGHEKMLVGWLAQAAAHGLVADLYGAPNEALARECEAAGLARPFLSHPPRGNAMVDALATWRLLGRLPPGMPVLLAPNVLQAAPLQWLAALLRRRPVAGYVPMCFPARQMRYRAGGVRDWIAARLARRVHLWITINAEQRSLLEDRWNARPPVLVVQNRLALLGEEPPQSPAAAAGPLRVLYAGRFDGNQKGLDWLCARLRASPGRWQGRMRFTFQGEGGFGAELLRLAAELGDQHVRVRGWGAVAEAMAGADVLLLASRFEGLPLVALEATHYGVAVAATRQAGLGAFVPEGSLFEFGDEAGLWRVLEALRDPGRRAAGVAHGRTRTAELLSPGSFRGEIERLVEALARMERSRASA